MSYGYDRLRFIRPVFIGDTIKGRATVKDLRPHKRPSHGLLVEMVEVLNQHGTTVLSCEHLYVVERRTTA